MFDPYRTSEQFHDYDTSPDIWPSSGDMNTSWTHSSVMNRTSSDGICAENLSFASSRMKYHEPFHPSWDDRSMDTASFTYSPYPVILVIPHGMDHLSQGIEVQVVGVQ